MAADGSIIIDTQINGDGITSDLQDIKKGIDRMVDALDAANKNISEFVSAFTSGMIKVQTSANNAGDAIEEISEKIDDLKENEAEIPVYFSDDAGESVADPEWENGRRESIGGNAQEFDTAAIEQWINKNTEAEESANNLATTVESLKAKLKELSSVGMGFGADEYDEAYIQYKQASVALQEYKANLDEVATASDIEDTETESAVQTHNVLGSVISMLADRVRSLGASVRDAAAQMIKFAGSSIVSGLKKISTGILGINKTANKSTLSLKKMLMWGLGFRSLYTVFSKLRTYITDGFNNLAQYSDETNAALSELKSGLTQLKNSLATAFAPILTAIAPALTYLINLLTAATNAIAQFMAAISGKSSYTKAIAVQENYAGAIEDTGNAAKEAEGQLASFDKLNVQNNNSSGSGGGGGGTSASDMFTTEEIEPISFDSWGAAFDAFLDYLLNNGVPALRNGLSQLADWINTFSANLYEMFTFPGVQEKVALLGQEVANALNDFVNDIDWATLGGALGAGLNTALTFLVNLIYTFDWKNLGSKLATAFNSAIAEIDGYQVGQWLWAKFKIALETLSGFLENVDMKQFASSGSQIAIGLFDSITETIKNIEWKKLGQQVIDFVAGIDYSGVFTALSTALGSALGGLAAFLGKIIGTAVSEAGEYFEEKIAECGGDVGAGILKGIADALANIATWINENIVTPFVNAFGELFGIAPPSTVMAVLGGYLVEGLLNGLTNAWSTITSWLNTTLESIKTAFTNAWNDVKTTTTSIWEGIANSLKGIINGIIGSVESMVNTVIKAINALGSGIGSIVSGVGDLIGLDISIPTLSEVHLPRLASGTVVPPRAGEYAAILGDNNRETEVVSPLSTMKQALSEALAESGFGSGDNSDINITLNLDGDVVYQTVVKRNRQSKKQTGKNLLLV